jgi:hypothetical protein
MAPAETQAGRHCRFAGDCGSLAIARRGRGPAPYVRIASGSTAARSAQTEPNRAELPRIRLDAGLIYAGAASALWWKGAANVPIRRLRARSVAGGR